MIYFLFLRASAVLVVFVSLTFAPAELPPSLKFTQNAQAQLYGPYCGDHPACKANLYAATSCRLYLDARNGSRQLNINRLQEEVNGVPRSYTRPCYKDDRVYALQGWRFNTRGGHKIKTIGFMKWPDRNGVEYSLHDNDAGDFADAFVWLSILPVGTEKRYVSRDDCRGECILELERDSADQKIVLSGFKFRRKDGDGHVKRLAVIPQASEGSLRPRYLVAFQDNDFDYDVTLQYALVPSDYIGRMEQSAKTYRPNDQSRYTVDNQSANYAMSVHSDLVGPRRRGKVVLRGFEFKFSNGGHFIEDIGVQPHANSHSVWFQDHQSDDDRRTPDDPFEWRVFYSFVE